MKILIICTHFPPDTNIAAKRPYMFAKYLSEFGHYVTVLCSGLASGKRDNTYNESMNKFRVITYLHLKETSQQTQKVAKTTFAHRKAGLVPVAIRDRVQKLYHVICEPLNIQRRRKFIDYHYQNIRVALDSMKDETFDVVFTTFSELSNIYAGAYAKEMFGCKWILDFRDRLVQLSHLSWLWNTMYKPVECKYIEKADAVTAISEDLFYGTKYLSSKIHTIYNGYEPLPHTSEILENSGKLSFCYTGMVYGQRALALDPLFRILASLVNCKQVDVKNLLFEYAGPSGEEVEKLAIKYSLHEIINQHGYLLTKDVVKLQQQSDVFVVLSWNHINERGILTGKFYDGIQVNKPILTLMCGETPNSELSRLNEAYHYGFCYEQANGSLQDEEFSRYILDLYKQKITQGRIEYNVSEAFAEKFKYENLTKELEAICFSLTEKK